MPTIQQIRQMYPDATNASDEEIVTRIQQLSGAPLEDVLFDLGVTRNKPGFTSAMKNALGAQAYGLGEVWSTATSGGQEDNALMRYGRDVQFRNPMDIESLGDIVDRPGDALAQGTGMVAGYLATALPGRALQALGGGLKMARMTQAGNVLNSAPVQVGIAATPSYGSIRHEQRQDGNNSLEDQAVAGTAALAVGALENAFGAQKMLGIGRSAKVNPLRQEISELAADPLRTGVRVATRTVGGEMGEELVQNPIEQLGAYDNPLTAQNINETLTGAALAGMGTLALGGAGGVRAGFRHQEIDRKTNEARDLLANDTLPLSARASGAQFLRDGYHDDAWYAEQMNRINQEGLTPLLRAQAYQQARMNAPEPTPEDPDMEQYLASINRAPMAHAGLAVPAQFNYNLPVPVTQQLLAEEEDGALPQTAMAVVPQQAAPGSGAGVAAEVVPETPVRAEAQEGVVTQAPVQAPAQSTQVQAQVQAPTQPTQVQAPEEAARVDAVKSQYGITRKDKRIHAMVAAILDHSATLGEKDTDALFAELADIWRKPGNVGSKHEAFARRLQGLLQTKARDGNSAVTVYDGQGNVKATIVPEVNKSRVKGATVGKATPLESLNEVWRPVVRDFMGMNEDGSVDMTAQPLTLRQLVKKYGAALGIKSQTTLGARLDALGYTEGTRQQARAAEAPEQTVGAAVGEDEEVYNPDVGPEDTTPANLDTYDSAVDVADVVEGGNLRVRKGLGAVANIGAGTRWRVALNAYMKKGRAALRSVDEADLAELTSQAVAEQVHRAEGGEANLQIKDSDLSQIIAALAHENKRRQLLQAYAAASLAAQGAESNVEEGVDGEPAAEETAEVDEEVVHDRQWWANEARRLEEVIKQHDASGPTEATVKSIAETEQQRARREAEYAARKEAADRAAREIEEKRRREAEEAAKAAVGNLKAEADQTIWDYLPVSLNIQQVDVEDSSEEWDARAKIRGGVRWQDMRPQLQAQWVKASVARWSDKIDGQALTRRYEELQDEAGKFNARSANDGAPQWMDVPTLGRADSAVAGTPAAVGGGSRPAVRPPASRSEGGSGPGTGPADGNLAIEARAEDQTDAAAASEEVENTLTASSIRDAWDNLAAAEGLPRFEELLEDQQEELLASYDADSLQTAAETIAREIQEEAGALEPTVHYARINNPDLADKRYTPLGGTRFSNGEEAARWLAANAKNPAFRLVAGKIAPFLRNTPVTFVADVATAPAYVRAPFQYGSAAGVMALWPDGRTEVFLNENTESGATEENLLHELVHAATQERLMGDNTAAKGFAELAATVQRALHTWEGAWPINDPKQRQVAEFFRHKSIFGDPGEFVAYALSSPTFQDVMRLMAADGEWNRTWREPAAVAKINKNASLSPQKLLPIPRYTMWQKLVDMVRSLLGLPKVYSAQIESLLAQNAKISEHNRKAQTIELRSLKEKVDALLDELLQKDPVTPAGGAEVQTKQASERVGVDHEGAGRDAGHRLSTPARNAWTDVGNALAKVTPRLMTLHQLAEQFGDKLKTLRTYISTMDAMEQSQQRMLHQSHALVEPWLALPKVVRNTLHSVMHDATLYAIHPDRAFADPANAHLGTQDRARYDELARRYKAMPEAAKMLYAQARQVMADLWDARVRAHADSVGKLYAVAIQAAQEAGDAKEAAKLEKARDRRIAEHTDLIKSMKGPYFPLLRNGDYVVVAESPKLAALRRQVEDSTGSYRQNLERQLLELERNKDHYIVEAYEQLSEAQAAAARFNASGKFEVVTPFKAEAHRPEVMPMNMAGLTAVSDKLYGAFDAKTAAKLKSSMVELYANSLPENHALRRQIRRKGVHGASPDMMRSFFEAAEKDAFYISRLMYQGDLSQQLYAMKKEARQAGINAQHVYDDLAARAALDTRYQARPILSAIARMSSIWHLGMSPAYLLTNMSQPWFVTAPVLAGRYGLGNTLREMSNAWVVANEVIRATRSGEVFSLRDMDLEKIKADKPEIYDLLTYINDRGQLDITMLNDTGMAAEGTNPRMLRALKWFNFANNTIEASNRITTAIAAYELAKSRGAAMDEARTKAMQVVVDTQLNYSETNAAYFMKSAHLGGLNKLIMQFRKYQQGMLYLIANEGRKAAKGDKAAIGALGHLLWSQILVAGAVGLPVTAPLMLLAGVFGDDDDEKGDVETRVRNALTDAWGADAGRAIWKGVPAMLGLDVSTRIGMGSLLMPLPMLRLSDVEKAKTGKEALGRVMVEAAGAPFGMAGRMLDSMGYFSQGDLSKGAEKLLPKFLADVLMAGRYAGEGMTTRRGDSVVPAESFSGADVTKRALGFTTNRESEHYAAQNAILGTQERIKETRTKLTDAYVRARNGEGDVAEVMERVREFNDRHSGPYRLKVSDLLKAYQERGKASRTLNAAGVKIGTRERPLRGLDRFTAGAVE